MAMALLIVEVVLSAIFWDWLNGTDSAGATIRNIGLVMAGSLALPLAIWRAKVADKQALAAQQQVNTAQDGLLNERYQKGAEMLGSDVLAVRMGGIYALQQLAQDHPEAYHIQIMELFCAFARRPPNDPHNDPWMPNTPLVRLDVQAVMDAIAARSESRRAFEKEAGFTLDLRGSDLGWVQMDSGYHLDGRLLNPLASTAPGLDHSRLELSGIDLSHARLEGANLHHADLEGADLSYARLSRTNLSDARLDQADLSHSSGVRTNLSRARLRGADLSNALHGEADLSKALLSGANLSDAYLRDIDLTRADLSAADLSGAYLSDVDLTGADLSGADLYGAHTGGIPWPAKGLTQVMLNSAIADPNNPPKLDGVLDADTGKPLVWRGGASPTPSSQ